MTAVRLATIAALATLFSTSATAASYIEGSGGVTLAPKLDVDGFSLHMNSGYNYGASVGTDLTNTLGPSWGVREDLFYTNNQYSCCSAHLSGLSFMTNAIYHFSTDLPLQPYVGLGVGGVDIGYVAPGGMRDSQIKFGGQVLGGIDIPISRRVAAFAEYRFIDADKARMSVGPVEYQSHNFTFGLKLRL